MQGMCIDDSAGFLRLPLVMVQELAGECDAMVLLAYLCNTFNLLRSAEKLGEDGSFYLSTPRIMQALGLTRRKYEHARQVLIKKKLVRVDVKPTEFGRVQFFFINCKLYNQLIYERNFAPKLADIGDVVEQVSSCVQKGVVKPKQATVVVQVEEGEVLPPALTNEQYKNKIVNAWNLVASKNDLPKIIMLKDDRLKKFKAVLKYLNYDEKTFFNAINNALCHSKFLRGVGKKWRADFDFFLSKQKALKAIEGGYKDNENEFLERLQDVETMSYREAQQTREKLEMQQWEQKYRAKEQLSIEENNN